VPQILKQTTPLRWAITLSAEPVERPNIFMYDQKSTAALLGPILMTIGRRPATGSHPHSRWFLTPVEAAGRNNQTSDSHLPSRLIQSNVERKGNGGIRHVTI
jgi:hypothetical protein